MSNGNGNKTKCNYCGCKVRGSNHTAGHHHQARVKIETKPAAK
ncbi:MAG: hypothetical protein V4719_01025 [Planctomycetota bacterium]